ncbi:putative G-protein coupled receptor 25 [Ascaphus truei]|uniref:putative G-protein coupled receptor 25 n=1 Tax=Ascaphus truei TaxID=8439 RepID=UPI003F598834
MTMESLTSGYYAYDYYNLDYDYANETRDTCPPQDLSYARWLLPTLYSAFFLLGSLGNTMVIAILSGRRSRLADTFILHLAASDLLFVLTLPLWASSLALGGRWPFGVHLCRASGFTIAVTRCASSLLMAGMSVDRYLAVVRGQKSQPLRTRTCSFGSCCAVWVVSLLSGIPSFAFRHLDDDSGACVEHEGSSLQVGLKMATILLTFILPLSVVLFCYCSVTRRLRSHFGGQQGAHVGMTRPQRGHSWLRIVFCVVAAYSLSWLPYNALSAVAAVSQLGPGLPCPTRVAIRQALSAAAALAFANSCANPLIYALLDSGFRRRAQLTLMRLPSSCHVALLFRLCDWSPRAASSSAKSGSTFTGSG